MSSTWSRVNLHGLQRRVSYERDRALTARPTKRPFSAANITKEDEYSNSWPYSNHSLREVIAFEDKTYQYDKTFLDHLKRLKTEVSVFSTALSRKKSRASGYKVSDEVINKQEMLLIENIETNIKKVDNFVNQTEQRLREKESKARQRKRKKQRAKNLTKEDVTLREALPEVWKDQADNEEIILFRDTLPIHVQLYMDSLGKTEYRYSRETIKIALGVKLIDEEDDRNANHSQYLNSQCSSRGTDISDDSDDSDDLVILDEPFPQVSLPI